MRRNTAKQNDTKKMGERSVGQSGIAKAEPNRTVASEANMGNQSERPEDEQNKALFEPYYHPEAASSDGKARKWLTMGKSAVLIFPEGQKEDGKNLTEGTRVKQEESKNKAANNKSRPNDVPGPIGALMDQAEVVGLHLATNQQDELEFRREGRSPIPGLGERN